MNKVDYLIIGQGVAGTMLAFKAMERGKTFRVAGKELKKSSSYISSGIINPVTGRRIVKSWMIDTLLEEATYTYSKIGELLHENFITCSEITRLIADPEEENLWLSKMIDHKAFLDITEDAKYAKYFKDFLSAGKIRPALVVNIKKLLTRWEEFLKINHLLICQHVQPQDLLFKESGVEFGEYLFENVILADGHQGLSNNFFDFLPYKNAKGEVLHIRSALYKLKEMIKGATNIIPEDNDSYWVGSNYEWDAADNQPSEAGFNRIKKKLDGMVQFPYELISHKVGIRACSIDRKPYLGQHPQITKLWIMNGLGTKGISLAPYFSEHLLDHIEDGIPLMPEVDIARISTGKV